MLPSGFCFSVSLYFFGARGAKAAARSAAVPALRADFLPKAKTFAPRADLLSETRLI